MSESPDIPLRQLVEDSASASASPISEFPRPHLPTPAKSPSLSASPETRMPSLPPIAVKLEEHRQCLSPVSSLDTPFLLRSATYMHPNETRSASILQQFVRRFSATLGCLLNNGSSASATTKPTPRFQRLVSRRQAAISTRFQHHVGSNDQKQPSARRNFQRATTQDGGRIRRKVPRGREYDWRIHEQVRQWSAFKTGLGFE